MARNNYSFEKRQKELAKKKKKEEKRLRKLERKNLKLQQEQGIVPDDAELPSEQE